MIIMIIVVIIYLTHSNSTLVEYKWTTRTSTTNSGHRIEEERMECGAADSDRNPSGAQWEGSKAAAHESGEVEVGAVELRFGRLRRQWE
jgi:hypothetical protein